MRKHEIEQLIRSLGIGATYRGYHYLVYGVSFAWTMKITCYQ